VCRLGQILGPGIVVERIGHTARRYDLIASIFRRWGGCVYHHLWRQRLRLLHEAAVTAVTATTWAGMAGLVAVGGRRTLSRKTRVGPGLMVRARDRGSKPDAARSIGSFPGTDHCPVPNPHPASLTHCPAARNTPGPPRSPSHVLVPAVPAPAAPASCLT
jgi:hypothetical protein